MPSRRTTSKTSKANQLKPLRRATSKVRRNPGKQDKNVDKVMKQYNNPKTKLGKGIRSVIAGSEKREDKTTSYRKAGRSPTKRRLTTRRRSGGLY